MGIPQPSHPFYRVVRVEGKVSHHCVYCVAVLHSTPMSRQSNFVSTGDDRKDRLAFFHIIEKLKVTYLLVCLFGQMISLRFFIRHRSVLDG